MLQGQTHFRKTPSFFSTYSLQQQQQQKQQLRSTHLIVPREANLLFHIKPTMHRSRFNERPVEEVAVVRNENVRLHFQDMVEEASKRGLLIRFIEYNERTLREKGVERFKTKTQEERGGWLFGLKQFCSRGELFSLF